MPNEEALNVANEYLGTSANADIQSSNPTGISNPYTSSQGTNPEIEELISQAKQFLPRDSYEFKLAMQMASAYYQGDWISLLSILQQMKQYKVTIRNDVFDWVNMMINQQNVSDQRSYETEMRDTSLTSSANQLEQLGLSSSGVLQVGGSSAGVSSGIAQNYDGGFESRALNKYNAKLQLGKSLLSMTSQMASAGIHGNPVALARKAAGIATSAVANSSYKALKSISGK